MKKIKRLKIIIKYWQTAQQLKFIAWIVDPYIPFVFFVFSYYLAYSNAFCHFEWAKSCITHYSSIEEEKEKEVCVCCVVQRIQENWQHNNTCANVTREHHFVFVYVKHWIVSCVELSICQWSEGIFVVF